MPGDVNNDGMINVLDVVSLIDFILFPNENNIECYDVNGDELINILDVVNTVNIILNI